MPEFKSRHHNGPFEVAANEITRRISGLIKFPASRKRRVQLLRGGLNWPIEACS